MNILNSSLQYPRPVTRKKKDENEEKEQKNI